ncbi:unnamed protein product, partial [Amoebophrya sp. A25]|eukprot:GSA25T00019544001.1
MENARAEAASVYSGDGTAESSPVVPAALVPEDGDDVVEEELLSSTSGFGAGGIEGDHGASSIGREQEETIGRESDEAASAVLDEIRAMREELMELQQGPATTGDSLAATVLDGTLLPDSGALDATRLPSQDLQQYNQPPGRRSTTRTSTSSSNKMVKQSSWDPDDVAVVTSFLERSPPPNKVQGATNIPPNVRVPPSNKVQGGTNIPPNARRTSNKAGFGGGGGGGGTVKKR